MGNLSMSIGPLVRLLAAIGAVSSVAMIALLNLHYRQLPRRLDGFPN